MGEKRRQQVTGLTKAERVKRAEESRQFWIIKQLKKVKNWRGKDGRKGKANNSRSGQREAWEI